MSNLTRKRDGGVVPWYLGVGDHFVLLSSLLYIESIGFGSKQYKYETKRTSVTSTPIHKVAIVN